MLTDKPTGLGRDGMNLTVCAISPITNKDAQEAKMDKWVCTICGYVYDPAQGDPDNDVEAGTAFEDIPDDWECPICGAPKDDFEVEE